MFLFYFEMMNTHNVYQFLHLYCNTYLKINWYCLVRNSQFKKKIEDILIIFRCFQYWIIPDFDNLTNYEGFIERYNLIRHTDLYVDHIVKYKKNPALVFSLHYYIFKKGAQKATCKIPSSLESHNWKGIL